MKWWFNERMARSGSIGGLVTAAALAAGLVWQSAPLFARTQPEGIAKPDPESLLIEVYRDLAADHLRAAQAKADELVAAYPNFRLGQLVRGDLLMMNTHVVTTFGDVQGAPEDRLKNLREEAFAHLTSRHERPDPNLVPRSVLQLRDDQKHVLVVDAKHSRMYVYENQEGRLRLIDDFYVSQGKLGVNKLKAGDQKTPLGVYYITGRLPGARLPDFYGVGALPINYPNDWDKLNGRSGSGIWLHGTPSDSFSRPPLSSDGCVVLTNPDLHKLYDTVEIGKTPVVIADHVEFVSSAKRDAERNVAAKLLETWRRDIESLDPARILGNYSSHFKSATGDDLGAWLNKQPRLPGSHPTLTLTDATMFLYPGQQDMMVGTFTEEAVVGKYKQTLRKRQYWAREGSQWKIVSEANL